MSDDWNTGDWVRTGIGLLIVLTVAFFYLWMQPEVTFP